MKKYLALLIVFVLVTSALTGCSGGGEDQVTLNVYNWGDYIDESILDDFEAETGIKVNYEMFATNEDMYVKLKQGGTKYDVAFPSDYMIEKMIKEDMLTEIDMSKLENYNLIMDEFKGLDYDPDEKYSVPYMWGTVGILYNESMVSDPVDSWDILWDEKYEGNILMMDSQRDTLMVALKKLGYSMNTRSVEELEAAKQALVEQKPLVLAYVGDNVVDMMLSGEAAMSVVWSGQAIQVMMEADGFEYAYPKEGTNLWFDGIVIPKTSEHVDEAHQFIDFLNRKDIAFRNADYIGYSSPNQGAVDQIDDAMKSLSAAYPDMDKIKSAEVFLDPGAFIEEYNRIWTELKAE
jgi:spermidine/putrescine transport system substrate-binding protein